MTARLSAVALRTILFDTEAGFLAWNSTTLPDGATAYVAETQSLYRLYKNGSALLGITTTGLIVRPNDQSGAAWVLESEGGSSPWVTMVSMDDAASPFSVTIANNNWVALTAPAADTFVQNLGSDDAFQLNSQTGVITYRGPTRLMEITVNAAVGGQDTDIVGVNLAISVGDDIAAGSSGTEREKGAMLTSTDSTYRFLSAKRIVELSNNDTIGVVLRNSTNTDDISFAFVQILVEPA